MSALAGRVVIVTRAEHQAAAFESLLRAEGATTYRYPCLAIAPPDNVAPLDDALQAAAAGQFDWLAFTSANTVDAVAQRLAALAMEPGALASLHIAAVGPSTARAVADSLGLHVETIPTSFSAVDMARAFPDIAGARILLPQSALADEETTRALAQRGARVTSVIAYQPGMSRGGVDLRGRRWDSGEAPAVQPCGEHPPPPSATSGASCRSWYGKGPAGSSSSP